jgi:hypothetical protein
MFWVGGKPMKTWNCFTGCLFECTYCNARKTALTRLKNSPRYCEGFVPYEVDWLLSKKFTPGEFVFIAYMGDISFASRPFVMKILHRVEEQPGVNFLACSKNPMKYRLWPVQLPANLYLGATIETTEDHHLSKAPPPPARYLVMSTIAHPRKFISIEPICDFDLDMMFRWMAAIKPEIIEVGADNYNNHLPEPPWEKVYKLLIGLKNICPIVVEKVGLRRLEQR